MSEVSKYVVFTHQQALKHKSTHHSTTTKKVLQSNKKYDINNYGDFVSGNILQNSLIFKRKQDHNLVKLNLQGRVTVNHTKGVFNYFPAKYSSVLSSIKTAKTRLGQGKGIKNMQAYNLCKHKNVSL